MLPTYNLLLSSGMNIVRAAVVMIGSDKTVKGSTGSARAEAGRVDGL